MFDFRSKSIKQALRPHRTVTQNNEISAGPFYTTLLTHVMQGNFFPCPHFKCKLSLGWVINLAAVCIILRKFISSVQWIQRWVDMRFFYYSPKQVVIAIRRTVHDGNIPFNHSCVFRNKCQFGFTTCMHKDSYIIRNKSPQRRWNLLFINISLAHMWFERCGLGFRV